MIYLLLHFLTAIVVGYNSYTHIWLHIIRLFEQFQSPSPFLKNSSTQSLLFLLSSDSSISSSDSQWARLVRWSQKPARVAFSLTVTATVLTIQFILWQFQYEEVSSLDAKLWEWNLTVLIVVLVFIQPALISVLLLNKLLRAVDDTIKMGSCALVMLSWLVFVSKSYTLTDMDVISGVGVLSYFTQRVSIMGVTLIAILNGVGSCSTVYYYLYKRATPKDEMDDEQMRQRIENLQRSIVKTEEMIRALPQNDQLTQRTNLRPKSSFLSLPALSSPPSELLTLTKLKNDMYVKLVRAQQSLTTVRPSQVTVTFNRAIAVYCLFKMTQVFIVHLLQFIKSEDINTSRSDPLVLTLVHIMQIFISQDEDFLINQLSFIISGVLFILSFNGVFLTLTHLYRFLPIDIAELQNSKRSVSVIKNMILAELLGIYVLATLLILKSNLTTTYSQNLSTLTLTGGMDITLVDNWFDKVYLLSVVVTGVMNKIGEVWMDDGFESESLAEKIV